jgi:hypothetical protein
MWNPSQFATLACPHFLHGDLRLGYEPISVSREFSTLFVTWAMPLIKRPIIAISVDDVFTPLAGCELIVCADGVCVLCSTEETFRSVQAGVGDRIPDVFERQAARG